ncbi:MAG TPA: DUF1059 domain-containing protein [archaeon]|nr:DUF1059 domain-containing protein [archaeon]
MQELSRITCDPKCGFSVQSHDKNEAIEVAKKHAKAKHKMNATKAELESMMTTVSG